MNGLIITTLHRFCCKSYQATIRVFKFSVKRAKKRIPTSEISKRQKIIRLLYCNVSINCLNSNCRRCRITLCFQAITATETRVLSTTRLSKIQILTSQVCEIHIRISTFHPAQPPWPRQDQSCRKGSSQLVLQTWSLH